jgi:hypothetical protein
MVNHIEPPVKTVRTVLLEEHADRIRLSKAAKQKILDMSDTLDIPVWMVIDRMVGVQ